MNERHPAIVIVAVWSPLNSRCHVARQANVTHQIRTRKRNTCESSINEFEIQVFDTDYDVEPILVSRYEIYMKRVMNQHFDE